MVRPITAVRKLARLGARSLTRAHVELARRPAIAESLREVVRALGEKLTGRVGAEVGLEPQLLDAAVKGLNSLAFPAAFAVVSLDAVGSFAAVEVEANLASALVDRLAGGPGLPSAPLPLTASEEAGLSLLLLEALAALRGTGLEKALSPRLVRVVHTAAELSACVDLRAPNLAIRIRVTCGEVTGHVRVLIPANVLRNWALTHPPQPRELVQQVAASALPFALLAGRAVLTPADLEGLVPGDVILLDGLQRAADALTGDARLVGIAFAIAGCMTPDGLAVKRLEGNQERPMSDKTQVMAAPELPVDVEIELATVRLTLAELGALQVGGVIPLKISTGEPVTLRVGDSAVAIAELVDIEGEIGARILRLVK